MSETKMESWIRLLNDAIATCHKALGSIYPNTVKNLTFEHVDESGYWFTYELENDSRRQNYVVRHREVV